MHRLGINYMIKNDNLSGENEVMKGGRITSLVLNYLIVLRLLFLNFSWITSLMVLL